MCIAWSFLRPAEAARILLNSATLKAFLLLTFLPLLANVLGVLNALRGLLCSGFVDPCRSLAFRFVCLRYALHLPILWVELLCK